MEKTKLLLDQAGALVQESRAKIAESGEAFNLFAIAKIERVEVNTHSAMIAEILNPQGRHGKGALFLGLLLSHMGIEHHPLLGEARVRKEQIFAAAQGRVDIVIHLPELLIFIENKIDAEDGHEQLKRYSDAGQASGKKWHLWYLTLQGSDADESSCRGVAYRRLSYREHILTWLEKCIAAVADTPALEHALMQYMNLVRNITGLSMTKNTKRALMELLSSGDNFSTADEISKALPFAKGAVLYQFFQAIVLSLSPIYFRSNPPDGFPGLECTEENCNRWFKATGTKAKNVGLFFDVGVPGALFRIEVATEALHYGLVPVMDGRLGSIEKLRESGLSIPGHLSVRDWKAFKWLSCLYRDNVASNMTYLMAPDDLILEVLQTIKDLVSAAHGITPAPECASISGAESRYVNNSQ